MFLSMLVTELLKVKPCEVRIFVLNIATNHGKEVSLGHRLCD